MSNSSNGVGLLPTPSDSTTAIGGVVLFAGVFLMFMGFNEYASGTTPVTAVGRDADINRIMTKAMDSGIRKIGLGIVAVLVGTGIAATRLASSLKKDEHASAN